MNFVLNYDYPKIKIKCDDKPTIACGMYLDRISLLQTSIRYVLTFITTRNLQYMDTFVKTLKEMNQVWFEIRNMFRILIFNQRQSWIKAWRCGPPLSLKTNILLRFFTSIAFIFASFSVILVINFCWRTILRLDSARSPSSLNPARPIG